MGFHVNLGECTIWGLGLMGDGLRGPGLGSLFRLRDSGLGYMGV